MARASSDPAPSSGMVHGVADKPDSDDESLEAHLSRAMADDDAPLLTSALAAQCVHSLTIIL